MPVNIQRKENLSQSTLQTSHYKQGTCTGPWSAASTSPTIKNRRGQNHKITAAQGRDEENFAYRHFKEPDVLQWFSGTGRIRTPQASASRTPAAEGHHRRPEPPACWKTGRKNVIKSQIKHPDTKRTAFSFSTFHYFANNKQSVLWNPTASTGNQQVWPCDLLCRTPQQQPVPQTTREHLQGANAFFSPSRWIRARHSNTFSVTPMTLMAFFTWGWLVLCVSSSQIHTPRPQMAMHLWGKEKGAAQEQNLGGEKNAQRWDLSPPTRQAAPSWCRVRLNFTGANHKAAAQDKQQERLFQAKNGWTWSC